MIKTQCLPDIAQRVRDPFSPWPCKWQGGGGGGGCLSNGHFPWEKWDFCYEFEKQFLIGNNSSISNLVFLLLILTLSNIDKD